MTQRIDNWLDKKIALAKKDRTDNPGNRILGIEVTDKGLGRLIDDIELSNRFKWGKDMDVKVIISSVLFGLFAFGLYFIREAAELIPFKPFLILTISAVLGYAVIMFLLWHKHADRLNAEANRAYWRGRQEAENDFHDKLKEYANKN